MELVKRGWRNLLESREALWREAGFLTLPSSSFGASPNVLILRQFVRALVPPPSVYVPIVLVRFTREAKPIKQKYCP